MKGCIQRKIYTKKNVNKEGYKEKHIQIKKYIERNIYKKRRTQGETSVKKDL